GNRYDTAPGELQFSGNSLSGIPALQLSGQAAVLLKSASPEEASRLAVHLDFFPEYPDAGTLLEEVRRAISFKTLSLDTSFSSIRPSEHPAERPAKETVKELLRGLVHEKLIPVILQKCCPDSLTASLPFSDDTLERLGRLLKDFPLTVIGTKPFKEAQVTHGGVGTEQLKPHSLEVSSVPGLYLAGEIVNVDGLCGGYNLHFAWGSGIQAAKEIIRAQNQ
ncbi:MAG TPA: NAD(P)/FAD-dependent oxidoreductase, partial [Clostridiales bacterium]|nr:NAD(P)/FAD-dependent oxidoreductase [Clostridiales bacterium]